MSKKSVGDAVVPIGIIVLGLALTVSMFSCSCGKRANASTPLPQSPYKGLNIHNVKLSNHAGQTFRISFGVQWLNGNTSPQPDIKVPQLQYGPGGVIIGGDTKSPVVVEHGFIKTIFTGAIEGSAKGQYRPRCYMDEGGNTTWYARLNATFTSSRAGTVYMNAFDDKGNLIASTTFEIDANLDVVTANAS